MILFWLVVCFWLEALWILFFHTIYKYAVLCLWVKKIDTLKYHIFIHSVCLFSCHINKKLFISSLRIYILIQACTFISILECELYFNLILAALIRKLFKKTVWHYILMVKITSSCIHSYQCMLSKVRKINIY